MDFTLSDEIERTRLQVREFVEQEVLPLETDPRPPTGTLSHQVSLQFESCHRPMTPDPSFLKASTATPPGSHRQVGALVSLQCAVVIVAIRFGRFAERGG